MSQLTVEIHAAGAAAEGPLWGQPLVDKLVEDRVASALADQDPTLWGPRAQPEATRRLAWVALPETSQPLLGTIEALRAQLRSEGIDRVVLAGADIAGLLDEAARQSALLAADDPANPALELAATLATGHAAGAEKVVLADTGSGILGFADWAEQLIAESTGKEGTGLLPVVVHNPAAPGFADARADATLVTIGPGVPGGSAQLASVATGGTLGGQFLLWEHAIAVVGRLLGINPFDQPDLEAAKVAARAQLTGATTPRPAFIDGAIAVHPVGDWLPAGVSTLRGALGALVAATPPRGYLAVQAYLDRVADASAAVLRTELARRTQLQTTFGWGPRFLHSTGQYHKGGHQNGAFLQLTGALERDVPVPGTEFTLGELQQAQAVGDAQVLAAHGRPVLRLHLRDRAAGLVALVHALQEHR